MDPASAVTESHLAHITIEGRLRRQDSAKRCRARVRRDGGGKALELRLIPVLDVPTVA
jgi:hypothetical protein